MSLTILILYLLILGVVSILSFRKGFQNIFSSDRLIFPLLEPFPAYDFCQANRTLDRFLS